MPFQRCAGHITLQRLPFEELHNDKGLAVFFADIVNGADIRMIDRGSSFGFAPEALKRGRVVSQTLRKKF